MSDKKCSSGLRAVLAIVSLALFATAIAAGEERVLYHFGQPGDGALPIASLIWDAAGNLYGTAACTTWTDGGACGGYGVVFELMPNLDGSSSEKVLHAFHCQDGAVPAAKLIFDAAGNLYGTTRDGGAYADQLNCYNGGTVFELTPARDGRWTEKVLHSFGQGADGQLPLGSLVRDNAGNLYGTTAYGGHNHGAGTVFKLTPNANGTWSETVLHYFGHGTDGQYPYANLIWDAAGNLYGTTLLGGAHGAGTVFQLTPNGDGSWIEKVLHHFGYDVDGQNPMASLTWDAAGNLYGTTGNGGARGFGTVFKLTPKAGGGSTEWVLHHFGFGVDGQNPNASLVWDNAGNLYGTTPAGGAHGGGTVFELTPKVGGGSTERVLHHFGYHTDGAIPNVSLIWDDVGNLYGTTTGDSAYGAGTVFELTP